MAKSYADLSAWHWPSLRHPSLLFLPPSLPFLSAQIVSSVSNSVISPQYLSSYSFVHLFARSLAFFLVIFCSICSHSRDHIVYSDFRILPTFYVPIFYLSVPAISVRLSRLTRPLAPKVSNQPGSFYVHNLRASAHLLKPFHFIPCFPIVQRNGRIAATHGPQTNAAGKRDARETGVAQRVVYDELRVVIARDGTDACIRHGRLLQIGRRPRAACRFRIVFVVPERSSDFMEPFANACSHKSYSLFSRLA